MASKQTPEAEHVLCPERNSLVIEDWYEALEWPGKLACCLLHQLLTSKSQRSLGIGQRILERLQEDVIETEGLTSQTDLWVREFYLLLCENEPN